MGPAILPGQRICGKSQRVFKTLNVETGGKAAIAQPVSQPGGVTEQTPDRHAVVMVFAVGQRPEVDPEIRTAC